MAEEKCGICLIGAMDTLWFHQIILFSETSLSLFPEVPQTYLPNSKSPAYSSKNSSQSSVASEEEISSDESERTINASQQDESSSQESDDDRDKEMRPTRLNLVSSKKNRSSHSSSPSAQKKESRKYEGYSGYSKRILKKTMSCKSLCNYLELEEVKGFMDLGFIFKKENLNKQMMSLIPGLQRIDAYKNEEKTLRDDSKSTNDDDYYDYDIIEEDEKTKGVVMRPYLSETWLIKRPDSPLLNLRIPRASTAADMKKHLKYWARTVASAIQQES